MNNIVEVAYSLYTVAEDGTENLVETAPKEHPFRFISGMGITLDAFEAQIVPLKNGESFDFTLSVDDAYGPYMQEHVVELDKEMFCVDGHFDAEHIFVGNIIPLTNADGMRFQGVVKEISDTKVTVDLNHPLAGNKLRFVGEIVDNKEANDEEVNAFLQMMTGGGGCSCSSCGCDDDGNGCDCGSNDQSCGCGSGCSCH